MSLRLYQSAVAACFVFWREIYRMAFWDFCNTIGTSRHSLRRNIFGRYRMHRGQTLARVFVHLAPFRPRFRATMPVDLAPQPRAE
jgi:hypothetical protein